MVLMKRDQDVKSYSYLRNILK